VGKLRRDLVLDSKTARRPRLLQGAHLAGTSAGPPDLVDQLQHGAPLCPRERQDGRHSPEAVLRGVLGRTYPEEVLSRVLYATQFTRYLDKQGYVKFKHWRLFGEHGLAGEEVSVWVYESTLKIEYQTTALALYSVQLSQDQQITEVTNPRRLETRFRSPQLDLWQLSNTEWLLALRRPEPAPRRNRGKIVALARQLPLPFSRATG
jgi:putative transposase